MEIGPYATNDPELYEQALNLAEEFESLPDGENKEHVLHRARVLNLGTSPDGLDGIGMVEAIAQSMQEHKDPQQPT